MGALVEIKTGQTVRFCDFVLFRINELGRGKTTSLWFSGVDLAIPECPLESGHSRLERPLHD
jgi:hypothetical protein